MGVWMRRCEGFYDGILFCLKKNLTIGKNAGEPRAQGNKPDKKDEDSQPHSREDSEAERGRRLPEAAGAGGLGHCCWEGLDSERTLEIRCQGRGHRPWSVHCRFCEEGRSLWC